MSRKHGIKSTRGVWFVIFTLAIFFISCLFFLANAEAYSMTTKIVNCPVCGEKVTIFETAGMTVSGKYRDFQWKVNGPYYEHLFGSCSVCHFAGLTCDFSQEVAVDIKEKVLKQLMPMFPGKKLTWIEQCEFAAKIHEWQKKRNERIADIYLIASYLCRIRGECSDSKRMKFQALACDYFIKALEGNEIKAEGRWEISYLIAELYRRQGNFERAIYWYDITLKEKNPDEFRETILEQREMAKNKDSNNDI
jgi:hypothetical protein